MSKSIRNKVNDGFTLIMFVPLLILVILVGVLVSPIGLYHFISRSIKKWFYKKRFFMKHQGEVWLLLTNGNRMKGIIEKESPLEDSVDKLFFMGIQDYENTCDKVNLNEFIKRDHLFPKLIHIEKGRFKTFTLRKEYLELGSGKLNKVAFYEYVKIEIKNLKSSTE